MRAFLVFGLAFLFCGGCTTYHGISRHNDSVYLTGSTGFLVFYSNWVRKCREQTATGGTTTLACAKLEVTKVPFRLTQSELHAAVERSSDIWSCAHLVQAETGGPVVTVALQIDGFGSVADVVVKSGLRTGGDAASCVVGQIKAVTFPVTAELLTKYDLTVDFGKPKDDEETKPSAEYEVESW